MPQRTAPMPRGRPLAARAGLRRTGEPGARTRETGNARASVTAMCAKPRKPLPKVSKKRAAQIRERRAMLQARYPGITLCEVPYCNRVADDAHEPLTRARGGSITDPGNVRAICRPHHRELTDEEPEWGYLLGFLVHSWGAA
jgi:hypothetical protein